MSEITEQEKLALLEMKYRMETKESFERQAELAFERIEIMLAPFSADKVYDSASFYHDLRVWTVDLKLRASSAKTKRWIQHIGYDIGVHITMWYPRDMALLDEDVEEEIFKAVASIIALPETAVAKGLIYRQQRNEKVAIYLTPQVRRLPVLLRPDLRHWSTKQSFAPAEEPLLGVCARCQRLQPLTWISNVWELYCGACVTIMDEALLHTLYGRRWEAYS